MLFPEGVAFDAPELFPAVPLGAGAVPHAVPPEEFLELPELVVGG